MTIIPILSKEDVRQAIVDIAVNTGERDFSDIEEDEITASMLMVASGRSWGWAKNRLDALERQGVLTARIGRSSPGSPVKIYRKVDNGKQEEVKDIHKA